MLWLPWIGGHGESLPFIPCTDAALMEMDAVFILLYKKDLGLRRSILHGCYDFIWKHENNKNVKITKHRDSSIQR